MNFPRRRAPRAASLLLAAALLAPAAPARLGAQTTRTPQARPAPRARVVPAARPARAKPAETRTGAAKADAARTGAAQTDAAQTNPAKANSTQANSTQADAAKPGAGGAAAGESAAAASAPVEVSIDNLFSADAYAIYGEMRMIGQHVNSAEFAQMLDPLSMPGAVLPETRDLLDFVKENAEQLSTARAAVGVMPVRDEMPTAVVAIELSSNEEARKLVPRLRATLARYGATTQEAAEGEPGVADSRAAQEGGAARRRGGRRGRGRAATVKAGAERQPQAAALPFQIRRAGRVVALSNQPFTFKKLRGADDALPLAAEPGFQAVRSRFATDSIFLYFNTTRLSAATKRQMEEYEAQYKRMQEMQKLAEAEAAKADAAGDAREAGAKIKEAETAGVTPSTDGREVALAGPGGEAGLSPEIKAEMERQAAAAEEALKKRTPEEIEQQRAAEQRREFENQLGRMIFTGGPESGSWPESIGVGASYEGETVVVRAFMLSDSEESPLRPIPFVPVLQSGPQVTLEAASVLPADTDVYVSASVSLTQMYDYVASMFKVFDMAAGSPDKQGIFDTQVGAFEREYKFRIREDLLAALGNEIAVALPAEMFGVRGRRIARLEAAAKEGAKDSQAAATLGTTTTPARVDSPVVVISLNDKQAVRDLLPRALEAAGIKGLNAEQLLEKRGQAEVVTFSQGSVAFIDRFLVLAFDPAAMNDVIDAYNSGRTLAADDGFRDPTQWQPRQQLGQVYVSAALLKGLLGDVHKEVADVDDERLKAYVATLDPNPGALTLATTKDGGLMYELHAPKNLISLWSAGNLIAQQLSQMRSNEGMAEWEMRNLSYSQNQFKEEHGRYGALAELKSTTETLKEGDGPPEFVPLKSNVEGYEIKVSASGDRFEATATPTGYPKQGRRSFYIDQTGVLRGADLGGRPANATTDPVLR